MDFLKELFGAGALAWDTFTKAVEENGLKIAYLSTGEYVSKQKHEFAVKEFTGEHTFTGEAAKREFIRAMIDKELSMNGDTIIHLMK